MKRPFPKAPRAAHDEFDSREAPTLTHDLPGELRDPRAMHRSMAVPKGTLAHDGEEHVGREGAPADEGGEGNERAPSASAKEEIERFYRREARETLPAPPEVEPEPPVDTER